MGLFSTPKNLDKPGGPLAEDLVECAIINLKLWQENPDSDYLIQFAISELNNAMRKVRRMNDTL